MIRAAILTLAAAATLHIAGNAPANIRGTLALYHQIEAGQ